jgi:hypothetical protein
MAMTTTPHNHFDGIPLGGFERAICGVSKHIKAVSEPKANPVKGGVGSQGKPRAWHHP